MKKYKFESLKHLSDSELNNRLFLFSRAIGKTIACNMILLELIHRKQYNEKQTN